MDEPMYPLPGDAPVTVPFRRLRSTVAVIEVTIDRKAHRFILDTGATNSMISDEASTRAVVSLAGLAEPLKLMLAKGVSPDGVTGALAAAAEAGEVEVLRILLDAGADLQRPNSNGGTALLLAVSGGQTPCARELLARNDDARQPVPGDTGDTLMHKAARFNDPILLKLFAGAGAPNKDERSPLHVAIDNRSLLAVRFLLARGVSPKGSGLSAAEMAEYLSPKYSALQEEVKQAAERK